jgi:hypothetical protein
MAVPKNSIILTRRGREVFQLTLAGFRTSRIALCIEISRSGWLGRVKNAVGTTHDAGYLAFRPSSVQNAGGGRIFLEETRDKEGECREKKKAPRRHSVRMPMRSFIKSKEVRVERVLCSKRECWQAEMQKIWVISQRWGQSGGDALPQKKKNGQEERIFLLTR